MLPLRTLTWALLTCSLAVAQENTIRRMLPAVQQQGEIKRDPDLEKSVATRRAKIVAVLPADARKKLDGLAQKVLGQLSNGPIANEPERLVRLQLSSQITNRSAEQANLLCFYVLAEIARLIPERAKPTDDVDAVNAVTEESNLRGEMLLDRRSKLVTALSSTLAKIEKTPDTLAQDIK